MRGTYLASIPVTLDVAQHPVASRSDVSERRKAREIWFEESGHGAIDLRHEAQRRTVE